ncbi:MAG: cupredoxin domain-containing protein [Candidatus Paceibacterota bacterium]
MTIDKKTLYIIIGVVVLIIAGLIGLLLAQSDNTSSSANPANPTSQDGGSGTPLSETHAEVPQDIEVPDLSATATSVPEDVAIPKAVTSAAPGVSASLRVFEIKGENGTFSPSTVIAYTGDTIHVNFTAVDKEYDITFPDYNMKQTASKGQTKVLEFQAQATGKFTYYCDLCGGLKSKAVGYIIVAPLKTQ